MDVAVVVRKSLVHAADLDRDEGTRRMSDLPADLQAELLDRVAQAEQGKGLFPLE